jgi:hypothetical protein
VLHDLRVEDRHYQEAWVSGGHSQDLQTLISDTASANSSTGANSDAQVFNSDASNYLSQNSPYLYPGWNAGYDQVTSDINALATDCGLRNVPANNPGNS